MNELHDLLDRIEPPATDVAADVARGERALRRRRGWQISATATAVAALVAGGLALHGADAGGSEAGYAHRGSSATPSSPSATATRIARTHRDAVTVQQRVRQLRRQERDPRTHRLLQGFRNVLAEHLGGLGALGRANGMWSRSGVGGYSIGTHLDWDHGGEILVGVATSWRVTEWPFYPGPGTETTYRGQRARVLVDGQDLYVSVEHPGGEVATVTASATFGNNHTSIPSTGLTVPELLAAAADPRLELP